MSAPLAAITTLRLHHCRAEQAVNTGRYHMTALHYRHCLELAEQRRDLQATRFFACQLAACYCAMQMPAKAAAFAELAQCCCRCTRGDAQQFWESQPQPPNGDTDSGAAYCA